MPRRRDEDAETEALMAEEDAQAEEQAAKAEVWDAPEGAEKPVEASQAGVLTPEQEAKITTPGNLTAAQLQGGVEGFGVDALGEFNALSGEERTRLYNLHVQRANGERTRAGEMARSSGGYPGEIQELHCEYPQLHPTMGQTFKPNALKADPQATMHPMANDPMPPGSDEELGMAVVFAVPQGGASRSSSETRGGDR